MQKIWTWFYNFRQIRLLRKTLKGKAIIYLTGAGISVPSGIKPFRGKDGIYSNMPDLVYKLRPDSFLTDPSFLYHFHNDFRKDLFRKRPNDIHYLITRSAKSIITQNIDDLHEKSGFENTIHVHGQVDEYRCRSCHNIFKGDFEIDDACSRCDERTLRHNVVLFKEQLINQSLARKAMTEAQVFIAIGTSGTVYPVAQYPELFKGLKICINNERPLNHHMFDIVLIGNTKCILKSLLQDYH